MSFALAFTLINAAVMPAWALLILAPKWSAADWAVHSALWPILLGMVYIGGMALSLGFGVNGSGTQGPVSFTTIEGVRNIFATDMGVLIGWTHFLVFDLFVGMWEARDARRRGFSHALLIPCLLLTFILGPAGLLLYLILRKATGKGGWSLGEG